MTLLSKLRLHWEPRPDEINQICKDNPKAVQRNFSELQSYLEVGTTEERIIIANTIDNAIGQDVSVGKDPKIFSAILDHSKDETADIRKPLVRSVGRASTGVVGNSLASLTNNQETIEYHLNSDTHSQRWIQPAVREVSIRSPDKFADYINTVASAVPDNREAIGASAVRTLNAVSKYDYSLVAPHIDHLIELIGTRGPYQEATAFETICHIASQDPSVIDQAVCDQLYEYMISTNSEIRNKSANTAIRWVN